MKTPVVAIIGRANVGKSTLFNKITGRRTAIVNDERGVTRDRNYGAAEWAGKPFMLVDTGGVDIDGVTDLEREVIRQADLAMAEADSIIFLADNQQGLTPQDKEVLRKLRKTRKPVFLAVNKVDHPKHNAMALEFAAAGVNPVYPVSAEHGGGVAELLDQLVADFPREAAPPEDGAVRVAIIGKPNVGKSSLVNALLRAERCIVSAMPGTTRDCVDSAVEHGGAHYVLVDTAGIRRKGKTTQTLEKFSVIMSLKAIEGCDVAVLLIDGAEGVTDQDATIAGYAFERGRACVIMVNKWDLAGERGLRYEQMQGQINEKLQFLDFAPNLPISAKTGLNLDKFFPQVRAVYGEYSRKIPTSKLNECMEKALLKNPMSNYRGKFMKLFYSTQVRACPPTFQCFVNYAQGVHFSYRRYLTNSLRKAFGFQGTPVRLIFAQRKTRSRNDFAA